MLRLIRQLFGGDQQGDSAQRVILISLDCVRPETLGFYGDRRARTPNLDRLIQDGVAFHQAIAQAPYTPASHASILTGLNPYRHGIRTLMGQSLAPSAVTLQEILKRSGYLTAAFVSTQALSSAYGLNRGFDVYDEEFEEKIGWWYTGYKRPCRETTDHAIRWLKRRSSDEPFFLFLHYIDAHSMSGQRFCWDYQLRKVEMIDRQIGRILRLLDWRNWMNTSTFVVVSDHGDSFGEHGEKGHREYLYDTTLRIPLVIKFPASFPSWSRGTVIHNQVRSIDVAPTVLEILGLLPPADPQRDSFDGVSLVDICQEGGGPDLLSYSETCHEVSPDAWHTFKTHFLGLRDGEWKYIYDKLTGNEELYILDEDPSEMNNLALSRPEVASSFRDRLRELLNDYPESGEAEARMSGSDIELVVDRLRGLGYVE